MEMDLLRPHILSVASPSHHERKAGASMSKKAFLVGINNFPRQDWQPRGCINDTIPGGVNFTFIVDCCHIRFRI